MPNQEQSRDGIPRKDKDQASPDTRGPDGQASVRGTGMASGGAHRMDRPMAGEERGVASGSPGRNGQRGDGPGKIGLTSDEQPDLVAPSGVNDRDPQSSGSAPVAGETLNFDDGTDAVHPRGRVTGQGRTWDEQRPSDAGGLGAPNVGMSGNNGPSDPDAKKGS